MSNNDKLRKLMQQHRLSRPKIAELSGYTVSSVDRWLRPLDHERYAKMPDRALHLLELRIRTK